MSSWRDQALCAQEDPELFFPEGNQGPALDQIADAQSICRRCPVLASCQEEALTTGQDFGIWGGLTPQERRELRRGHTTAQPTPRPVFLDVEVLDLLDDGRSIAQVMECTGLREVTVRRIRDRDPRPSRRSPSSAAAGGRMEG